MQVHYFNFLIFKLMFYKTYENENSYYVVIKIVFNRKAF